MANLIVEAKLSSASSAVTVTVLPYKYGKNGTFIAFGHDDASPGFITINDYIRSKSFPDGCGNQISFTHGWAVLNGLNGNATTEEGIALLEQRNTFENHTKAHAPQEEATDKYQDFILQDQAIFNQFGYKMNVFVPPSNITGYSQYVIAAKYKAFVSANDLTFDGNPKNHQTLSYPPTQGEILFITRDINDELGDRAVIDFFKQKASDAVANGTTKYAILYTHSTFETPAKLAGMKEIIDHVQNIIGNNTIVCTVGEIMDYREMSIQPMSYQVVGDTVTITITDTNVSERTRFKDLSLRLNLPTGITISSVTTQGFESNSFNPATGLINAYLDTFTPGVVNPPDPEPSNGDFLIKWPRKFSISASQPTIPSDSNKSIVNGITTLEASYFENGDYYNAASALNFQNIEAVNGNPVKTYVPLIGNNPINYIGESSPTLTGAAPALIKNLWVDHRNQPLADASSISFTDRFPPMEQQMIFVRMPGQSSEAFSPGGEQVFYFADGGDHERAINSAWGNLSGTANYSPAYIVSHNRIVIKGDATVEYWLNGIKTNTLTLQNGELTDFQNGTLRKRKNGIGVNTNVADHWFGMQATVAGVRSDSQFLAQYEQTKAKWAAAGYTFGQYVFADRLYNLLWQRQGDFLVPTFDIVNTSGKVINPPSQWKWKWYFKTNETNYFKQTLIGNTMNLPITAYPKNGPGFTSVVVKYEAMMTYEDGSDHEMWLSNVFAAIPVGTGHD